MHRVSNLLVISFIAALAFSVSAVPANTAGLEKKKGSIGGSAGAGSMSWDELVKAAQKEGTVNIYAADVGPAIRPLTEAFQKRYGIKLEFVYGRPAEVQAKLEAERRAGLYLADLGHLGETTVVKDIKPLGITVPLPDWLVLPEVKDPKNWIGGRLPFLDKDQHVFLFMASAFMHAAVNADMIKDGDLTSYTDLLDPKWKGKIVFSDPTISGGAPNQLAALFKAWGRERGIQFLTQLAAQEPVLTRDQRQLMEWVARGKYPIALGQSVVSFGAFRRAGAPVKLVSFKEPRHVYGGPGTLSVFSKNPHPKATQVYINWLLTKEGATVSSKGLNYSSTRVDVGKEWLDANTIPRPGDIFPDEEQLQLRVEMRKITAKIFHPQSK